MWYCIAALHFLNVSRGYGKDISQYTTESIAYCLKVYICFFLAYLFTFLSYQI